MEVTWNRTNCKRLGRVRKFRKLFLRSLTSGSVVLRFWEEVSPQAIRRCQWDTKFNPVDVVTNPRHKILHHQRTFDIYVEYVLNPLWLLENFLHDVMMTWSRTGSRPQAKSRKKIFCGCLLTTFAIYLCTNIIFYVVLYLSGG